MGQKSKIKKVFRMNFFTAVRVVPIHASDGKSNFVPRKEKRDLGATIENASVAFEDTGVRMHGFTNVRKVTNSDAIGPDDMCEDVESDEDEPEDDDNDENGARGNRPDGPPTSSVTGYRVEQVYGTKVASHMLLSAKRTFAIHGRVKTFVIVFDKSAMMPRPKKYTQIKRTNNILGQMVKEGISPIIFEPGKVPLMVTADTFLPPWTAVRANRTLYGHACNQAVALIVSTYQPPPGCRVIIDILDMNATAPNSIDEWMHSARLLMDEYAQRSVEQTRELQRGKPDWAEQCYRMTYELGHTGHVKSVPILLETDEDGHTYAPLLLFNAANYWGEGDMAIHGWCDMMSEERRHITLAGERRIVTPIDQRNLEFYDDEQIRQHNKLLTERGPQPIPLQDLHDTMEVPGDEDANPCTHPNRSLIYTCDTDFLSITLMWYAMYCYRNRNTGINCIDNAPLFSIGQCKVHRTGWIQSADDFYIEPKKTKKLSAVNPNDPVIPERRWVVGLEIWDVHRLWQLIGGARSAKESSLETLERVASFAMFCAGCGNDFLNGFRNVVHETMWTAYAQMNQLQQPLVRLLGPNLTAFVVPSAFIEFLRRAFYRALVIKPGEKNKFSQPVEECSYAQIAAVTAKKYKTIPKGHKVNPSHMPDAKTLCLIYERWTWCINYVTHGWKSNVDILDDSVWGWKHHTIKEFV